MPPLPRVMALVATYNEDDIIEQSIGALVDDGVQVYVIDNWSTDTIKEFLAGRGLKPSKSG